jgi:hypothetical protein
MNALLKSTPFLPDHGVPQHNVFRRASGEDFSAFHSQVCDAAEIARRALDAEDIAESVNSWWELFGSKFPSAPLVEESDQRNFSVVKEGGYSPREGVSTIGGGRFA